MINVYFSLGSLTQHGNRKKVFFSNQIFLTTFHPLDRFSYTVLGRQLTLNCFVVWVGCVIFGASALYFYNTVNMYGTPSWVGKLEYSSVLPVLEAKSSNQEGSEPEVELKQIFHLRKNANFVYSICLWRNFVFTKIFAKIVTLFPFSRTLLFSRKFLVKKHIIFH